MCLVSGTCTCPFHHFCQLGTLNLSAQIKLATPSEREGRELEKGREELEGGEGRAVIIV